jgi:hypothetical protein
VRNLNVNLFLTLTWAAPVLLWLTACAHAPAVVYQPVDRPVPVHGKIDPRLTADCQPVYEIGLSEKITVDVLLHRLESVEDALWMCRLQLEKLRQAGAAQQE